VKLKLSILDKTGAPRGEVGLTLDFDKKRWSVAPADDPLRAWGLVGYTNGGSLECHPNGLLCLWDHAHNGLRRNVLILHDPPAEEKDTSRKSGKAQPFEPMIPEMKSGRVTWKQEEPEPATESSLTPARAQVRSILNDLLPCEFLDKKYKKNVYAPTTKFSGTTCGCLPAMVAFRLGKQFKFGAVTTGLPREGRRYNAWVPYEQGKRPRYGDFYALVTGGPEDSNVTHVGVIIDASTDIWITADMGQGDGYAGRLEVKRAYNAKENLLTGERKDWRPVYGWIDVDLLVGNKKSS
jgi:hypothetical protein